MSNTTTISRPKVIKETAFDVGNAQAINHGDIFIYYRDYDERIDKLLMTEFIYSC